MFLPELCENHWLAQEFLTGLDQTQRRILETKASFSQGTCWIRSQYLQFIRHFSFFLFGPKHFESLWVAKKKKKKHENKNELQKKSSSVTIHFHWVCVYVTQEVHFSMFLNFQYPFTLPPFLFPTTRCHQTASLPHLQLLTISLHISLYCYEAEMWHWFSKFLTFVDLSILSKCDVSNKR